MKMRSLLCLVGVLALTGAAGLSLAQSPPSPPSLGMPPFTLRAALNVNGAPLTVTDSQYTLAVTDTSGNALPDANSLQNSVTYGGGAVAARFQYEIPMSGPATPSVACVAVSYKGTPLTVTYPAKGTCPAGSGQLTSLASGYAAGFGSTPAGAQNPRGPEQRPLHLCQPY